MLAEGYTLYIQTEANYPLAGAHGPELKVGVSTKKVWPSPTEEAMVGSLVPHTHVPWSLPVLELEDRVYSQRRPSPQQSLIQAILTQCPRVRGAARLFFFLFF